MKTFSPSVPSYSVSKSSTDGNIPAFTFKYVIVGETAVGKSCFLLQFAEQRFKVGHELTIGAEYGARWMYADGNRVRLKIWDTAGSEQFRSVSQHYYRGAVGALLVYDVTSRKTFTEIYRWLADIRTYCSSDVTIMLIANKCDLDVIREVKYEEGFAFAREHDLMFIEASAKTSRNVDRAFTDLTMEILHKTRIDGLLFPKSPSDTTVLSAAMTRGTPVKKCC